VLQTAVILLSLCIGTTKTVTAELPGVTIAVAMAMATSASLLLAQRCEQRDRTVTLH
jgi:hypothetical protein